MVNPWEGGMVPGSSAMQGAGSRPDLVASISHLSRMDNRESELALNIINAVLTNVSVCVCVCVLFMLVLSPNPVCF